MLVEYKDDRYILTNHHVLQTANIAKVARAYFDFERTRCGDS